MPDDETQEGYETPLRIAGTRPAMKFGVPIWGWSACITVPTMFAAIQLLWTGAIVGLTLATAFWLLFKFDHNILRVEAAYWRTRGRDWRRFAGRRLSSVSALPVRLERSYRGVPASGMVVNDAGD